MASITKKVGEGTIYSFSQNFLTIILGAFSTIFVIRELGSYQYGLVILALSITNVLNIFLDFGIGNVIVADIAGNLGADKLSRAKRLLKDYLFLEIITGGVLFVVAYLLSFYADTKYGLEISRLVKISSALVLLNAAKNIFVVFFYSFSRFKLLASFFVMESVAKFLAVLGLVVLLDGGMVSVMLTYLIAPLAAILFMSLSLVKVISGLRGVASYKEKLLFGLVKEHGKFQTFLRSIQNLFDSLRIWIIQIFAGATGVAVFQVSLRFFGYLSQLVFAASTPLLSVLSEELGRDRENARRITERISKYLTWISIFTMATAWAFTPAVLGLFFGDKYDASVPLIRLLLLGYFVGGIGVVMRPVFFALKAQKELLKSDLLSFFITYPISTFLTFLYGPVGFALPIGIYATFFLRYSYLKKLNFNFIGKIGSYLRWDKEDTSLVRRIYSVVLKKIKRRQEENSITS